MWALGTNGSLTARNETVGTDTTIIDAITKSASFPIAFMGRIDVQRGKWSAYGDFAFAQLRFADSILKLRSPTADILIALTGNGHLRQTLGIGEAGVGYELASFRQSTAAPDAYTAFDAYAGARYGYMGASLNLTSLGVAGSQLLGEGDVAFLQSNVTARIWSKCGAMSVDLASGAISAGRPMADGAMILRFRARNSPGSSATGRFPSM
jgi:hypothetical protein